jgi:beta-lactamase superfamily II metal-dependent hydrolase
MQTRSALVISILAFAAIALRHANGKLQIHNIDVGQGDGAVSYVHQSGL